MNHERLNDLPDWLKWGLTVFNRAGFPTIAFGVVSWLLFVKMEQQTRVMDEFKGILIQMRVSMESNTDTNKRLIEAIYRTRNR
jgi:hypothetical protein